MQRTDPELVTRPPRQERTRDRSKATTEHLVSARQNAEGTYGLADGSAEPETVGAALPLGRTDGFGIGVGSVKRLLGKPANESAKISTKMANTTMTHGRASMSSRGGSAPR